MRTAVKFLSTPSARRAAECAFSGHRSGTISIHALREEGDLSASYYYTFSKISIHALREEGDQEQLLAEINRRRFLSTPSARRATTTILTALRHLEKFLSTPSARRATHIDLARDLACDISIHALREEGDSIGFRHCIDLLIYIHALREEGDKSRASTSPRTTAFLSTPSARRATAGIQFFAVSDTISIHALREEGDS